MLCLNVRCIRSQLTPGCHLCHLAHWLTTCRSSSPAHNWIWVWDRGPVGSEIKEGRLSLHLRRGRQISRISFLLQTLSIIRSASDLQHRSPFEYGGRELNHVCTELCRRCNVRIIFLGQSHGWGVGCGWNIRSHVNLCKYVHSRRPQLLVVFLKIATILRGWFHLP